MSYVYVSRRLGEDLLRENGIEFDAVLQTEFEAAHAGGCPTCAYTEYAVAVTYKTGLSEKIREFSFDYFSEIIKRLEDIAEEIFDR